jgi:hypothetical protein
MAIFSHIEHISHKYPTEVKIFTQISNESQFFTQMTIFSHIEHILHNHFADFYCGLVFFFQLLPFMVVAAQV